MSQKIISLREDEIRYLDFLRSNRFTVTFSRKLSSTIPLEYAECRL